MGGFSVPGGTLSINIRRDVTTLRVTFLGYFYETDPYFLGLLLGHFIFLRLVPRLFYVKNCIEGRLGEGAQRCLFVVTRNGQRWATEQKETLRTYFINGPQ